LRKTNFMSRGMRVRNAIALLPHTGLSHVTICSVIPSEAASLPRAKSRGSAPVGMTEFLVKCDSPAYDGGGKALLAFC
jgi:hypothetical protein